MLGPEAGRRPAHAFRAVSSMGGVEGVRPVLQALEPVADEGLESVEGDDGEVGQAALDVSSDPLGGVEVGRVGRRQEYREPCRLGNHLAYGVGDVGVQAVPDRRDRCPDEPVGEDVRERAAQPSLLRSGRRIEFPADGRGAVVSGLRGAQCSPCGARCSPVRAPSRELHDRQIWRTVRTTGHSRSRLLSPLLTAWSTTTPMNTGTRVSLRLLCTPLTGPVWTATVCPGIRTESKTFHPYPSCVFVIPFGCSST